jgi:hypothetical protein
MVVMAVAVIFRIAGGDYIGRGGLGVIGWLGIIRLRHADIEIKVDPGIGRNTHQHTGGSA